MSLPQQDRWLLLQAWIVMLAVDLGLRLYSFGRLQRYLEVPQRASRTSQMQPSEEQAWSTIQRLQSITDIARRHHLYPMTCLRHALALQWLLARHGLVAELKIGVKRENDALKAHAWLEYNGRPIGEPETITEQFGLLAPVK